MIKIKYNKAQYISTFEIPVYLFSYILKFRESAKFSSKISLFEKI